MALMPCVGLLQGGWVRIQLQGLDLGLWVVLKIHYPFLHEGGDYWS